MIAESPTHSTISKYDITVGSNFTLDVSAGTLTLAENQISGNHIDGGRNLKLCINRYR